MEGVLDVFFAGFERLLSADEDPVISIGQTVPIPTFSGPEVESLFAATLSHFKSQPTVLNVDHVPIVVVGDIHGNLRDLIRIFRTFGIDSTYLFLGDYVDRGHFSTACLLFLFTLLCKWPDRFFLLRGNHEWLPVCTAYGFRGEFVSLYSDALFASVIELFNWMPLAAVAAHSYFCVHGGICPDLHTIEQIADIARPVALDVSDTIAWGLLWNDPSESIADFTESTRKHGMLFGARAVADFLQATRLQYVLRGHQCVNGVLNYESMPVSTIFSSSDYSECGNRSGVVRIDHAAQMEPVVFPTVVRRIEGDAKREQKTLPLLNVKRAKSEGPSPPPHDPAQAALASPWTVPRRSRRGANVAPWISAPTFWGGRQTIMKLFQGRGPAASGAGNRRQPVGAP
jgi:diadenosine tetraphosphatase ApaH/serine/threonine PP2A family protein phosphatase